MNIIKKTPDDTALHIFYPKIRRCKQPAHIVSVPLLQNNAKYIGRGLQRKSVGKNTSLSPSIRIIINSIEAGSDTYFISIFPTRQNERKRNHYFATLILLIIYPKSLPKSSFPPPSNSFFLQLLGEKRARSYVIYSGIHFG